MPKPWGPVPPWTHLLLSTGSLKEPKHQHNSNLSPSRTRDIYAPQEQWLYTWNGYSRKTCKVQRKSCEGNIVCPAMLMLCCVRVMVLWIQLIRTKIPRTSAGASIYWHTAQPSQILLLGDHGTVSQLRPITEIPCTPPLSPFAKPLNFRANE